MTATLTLSGAVIAKAGANVSSSITGANWPITSEYEKWIEEAEAYLCDLVKYDLVTNWASLNSIYKLLFSEFCARAAAVQAIAYDMSGYTTRIEAEDMINIHLYHMQKIEQILNDSSTQDFLDT